MPPTGPGHAATATPTAIAADPARRSQRGRARDGPAARTRPARPADGRVAGGRGGSGTDADAPVQPARRAAVPGAAPRRSEEQPSELQSLMRNSYAVFCLNK